MAERFAFRRRETRGRGLRRRSRWKVSSSSAELSPARQELSALRAARQPASEPVGDSVCKVGLRAMSCRLLALVPQSIDSHSMCAEYNKLPWKPLARVQKPANPSNEEGGS